MNRLGFVFVTSRFERPGTVFGHGMGTQSNDRNVLSCLVAFKVSGGFPSVHNRQAHIHQDNVWLEGFSAADPLQSIRCGDNLKAETAEAPLEHVGV